jgi:hypothetical protein
MLPLSFKQMTLINEILPCMMIKNKNSMPADKCSFVFTNVAGSRTPIYFNGKMVYDILYFAPSLGKNCINLGVGSYCENINILAISDENRMQDPHNFIKMVDDDLKEYFMINEQAVERGVENCKGLYECGIDMEIQENEQRTMLKIAE